MTDGYSFLLFQIIPDIDTKHIIKVNESQLGHVDNIVHSEEWHCAL